PWVVGYGCRRGSALSGTDMDEAFVPFRDLDNLFDRPRGVVRASGWLKELQRLSRNNGAASRMVFEAAKLALRKVLLGRRRSWSRTRSPSSSTAGGASRWRC